MPILSKAEVLERFKEQHHLEIQKWLSYFQSRFTGIPCKIKIRCPESADPSPEILEIVIATLQKELLEAGWPAGRDHVPIVRVERRWFGPDYLCFEYTTTY
jgi:hypothetical protein